MTTVRSSVDNEDSFSRGVLSPLDRAVLAVLTEATESLLFPPVRPPLALLLSIVSALLMESRAINSGGILATVGPPEAELIEVKAASVESAEFIILGFKLLRRRTVVSTTMFIGWTWTSSPTIDPCRSGGATSEGGGGGDGCKMLRFSPISSRFSLCWCWWWW